MDPFTLLNLKKLMEISSGSARVKIGLLDGTVDVDNEYLCSAQIESIQGRDSSIVNLNTRACVHATTVASILSAKRTAPVPGLCPDCILLVRPVFQDGKTDNFGRPVCLPQELARGIVECIDTGVKLLNISAAFSEPSMTSQLELEESLDYAAQKGVITVVASGNDSVIGSSALTRHWWTIPAVACTPLGEPTDYSNLGPTIGRKGLMAPENGGIELSHNGHPRPYGTSIAAAFITGSIALIWSSFPTATATQLHRSTIRQGNRSTITPPLLDAWSVYLYLHSIYGS